MRNIPNALSVVRILMIPLFVWLLFNEHTTLAGLTLVASGATDLLDGVLARRYGWITDIGKVLDPLADKLTQAAVSVSLMVYLSDYWYLFAILIVKDAIMVVLSSRLWLRGVRIEGANMFGKVSTAVYYAAMILIVFWPGIPNWLTVALIGVSVACALVAFAMYVPAYREYNAQARDAKAAKVAKAAGKVSASGR